MRIIATVICSIMLLASGYALASQVTGVALEYKDGSAVAHIGVTGQVHFTHQTEEARDGRPFRVIVDVLSATHRLPAKNFTSLPACPVQRIRTSQFAVQPENVVRLVFDMEAPTFYRVTSDDRSVSVFFPDQQQRRFAAWSSESYAAPDTKVSPPSAEKPLTQKKVASLTPPDEKPAAEVQQAINEDRMLSLSGEAPATPVASTPKPLGVFR